MADYNHDIFISYSRQNSKIVDEFVSSFEKEGYSVWIDREGIDSGDAFAVKIVEAIEDSRVFIFFSSEQSNVSDWAAKEVGIAVESKKKIIPVKLDDSKYNKAIRFHLVNLDYIDYTNVLKRNEMKNKLFKDLHKILGGGNRPVPQRKERRVWNIITSPQNRKITIGCGTCLLFMIVALLSGYIYFNRTVSVEEIDLGLPSGTLWANKNIKAKNPYDYGEFYSWGETKTKNGYHQQSYLLPPSTNIVHSQYDVATTVLGDDWMLPTEDQMKELIKKCNWKWCFYGFKVTGPNGNSIFLPAAGWKCSSNVEHKRQGGYYWTSSITNQGFAKELLFNKTQKKVVDGYLYYGRSIRAVKTKK